MSPPQGQDDRSESAPATDAMVDAPAPSSVSAAKTQTELAQAFSDLARGEKQASALEANLASLETKLDALLAAFEASVEDVAPGGKEEGGGEKEAEEIQRQPRRSVNANDRNDGIDQHTDNNSNKAEGG
ncbi:hypothetical protein GGS20DRAFT_569026 [Poronia punctata]|nr:hypothetical protein GGS20DRAFT_569026 [Poronia punctata]